MAGSIDDWAITSAASQDNAETRQTTKSGAGDGNRTHGSSLGSLGITIIRRPPPLHCRPMLVRAAITSHAPATFQIPTSLAPHGTPSRLIDRDRLSILTVHRELWEKLRARVPHLPRNSKSNQETAANEDPRRRPPAAARIALLRADPGDSGRDHRGPGARKHPQRPGAPRRTRQDPAHRAEARDPAGRRDRRSVDGMADTRAHRRAYTHDPD